VILAGTLALPFVHTVGAMTAALAAIGIGIGPTLVTQYSFGAERSPVGRSATVMTILGSAVILARALSHPWQYAVLAAALILLLPLRRGVVLTLLAAAVAGVVIALAAGTISL